MLVGAPERSTSRDLADDHLMELGVTHVQLMPVYDFVSCSPKDPHDRPECYNWGYDPENFNVELFKRPVQFIRRHTRQIAGAGNNVRLAVGVWHGHELSPPPTAGEVIARAHEACVAVE